MSEQPDMERSGGDIVLQEVWQAKDTLSAKFGHNLEKMFDAIREGERNSARRVIAPPARVEAVPASQKN